MILYIKTRGRKTGRARLSTKQPSPAAAGQNTFKITVSPTSMGPNRIPWREYGIRIRKV